jgi:hypothetical protein
MARKTITRNRDIKGLQGVRRRLAKSENRRLATTTGALPGFADASITPNALGGAWTNGSRNFPVNGYSNHLPGMLSTIPYIPIPSLRY